MADINEKGASGSTKIVGSDADGNETNFANVTSEGELKISSFSNVTFIAADKTVNTTQSLAAVSTSNLSNRKTLKLINKGTKTVYYGPTGLSDTALSDTLESGESVTLTYGENLDVYFLTKTGTSTVTVWETA